MNVEDEDLVPPDIVLPHIKPGSYHSSQDIPDMPDNSTPPTNKRKLDNMLNTDVDVKDRVNKKTKVSKPPPVDHSASKRDRSHGLNKPYTMGAQKIDGTTPAFTFSRPDTPIPPRSNPIPWKRRVPPLSPDPDFDMPECESGPDHCTRSNQKGLGRKPSQTAAAKAGPGPSTQRGRLNKDSIVTLADATDPIDHDHIRTRSGSSASSSSSVVFVPHPDMQPGAPGLVKAGQTSVIAVGKTQIDYDDDDDDDDDDIEIPQVMELKVKVKGSRDIASAISTEEAPDVTAAKDAQSALLPQVEPDLLLIDFEPEPASEHEPELTLEQTCVNRLLEILPDIDLEWATQKIERALIADDDTDPVERVITAALEHAGGYPKPDMGSKVKKRAPESSAPGSSEMFKSAVYRAEERRGGTYNSLCIDWLVTAFNMTPLAHIRKRFKELDSLLVPTYHALLADSTAASKPYTELKGARVVKVGKGKGKAVKLEQDDANLGQGSQSTPPASESDGPSTLARGKKQIFEEERLWLENEIQEKEREALEKSTSELARAKALAEGGGIECGCCFTEEVWEELFQCQDGHLFCRECAKMHAETRLGDQLHVIVCMDQSGCSAPFPLSELARLLPTKSLDLYHRLKQTSELNAADIEGLESCPECPYAAVVENENERLFRCLNPDCGLVSCRKCHKEEHLPRTCEEAEADKGLGKRHAIEDAMSEALIRRCPNQKCKKPFIKTEGCNKIMCSSCRTMSCYLCRLIVKDYTHFDQQFMDPNNPRESTKCLLWDSGAAGDQAAIAAAREAAQQQMQNELEAEGVVVPNNVLDVDMPEMPRNQPRAPMINMGIPALVQGHLIDPAPLPPPHIRAGPVPGPPHPPPAVGAALHRENARDRDAMIQAQARARGHMIRQLQRDERMAAANLQAMRAAANRRPEDLDLAHAAEVEEGLLQVAREARREEEQRDQEERWRQRLRAQAILAVEIMERAEAGRPEMPGRGVRFDQAQGAAEQQGA